MFFRIRARSSSATSLSKTFIPNLVWVSNTFPRSLTKRAAAIGIGNGTGTTGNFIGSYVWKAEWGPEYHQSMEVGIAMFAFSTCLAFGMELDEDELGALKEVEHQRVQDAARLEGITLEEKEKKKGSRYLY
ncbi:hypothetical protein ACEPAG_3272 [Sanghuangporus baumii]